MKSRQPSLLGSQQPRVREPSRAGTMLVFDVARSVGLEVGAEPHVDLDRANAETLTADYVGESKLAVHAPAPKYTTTQLLGRGGMGEVALATDRDLRREVAIKSIIRADDRHALARFIEEAQVTGQLEHPNIVPIHELGLDRAKQPFLVMKRVQGRDLAAVLDDLRRGRPSGLAGGAAQGFDPDAATVNVARPVRPAGRASGRIAAKRRRSGAAGLLPRAAVGIERPAQILASLLDLFGKACDAIAYAHSRGVIHRDLKPDNIMVGQFGEVLVMDWGLAKVVGRPDAARDRLVITDRTDDPDVLRTGDGAVAGTPMYMSPEQAAGEVDQLDARTDVFALGAILYELVSLAKPYEAPNVYALLGKVVRGHVLPIEKRMRAPWPLPRELAAVVRRAMARNTGDRYESVEQLKADVIAYREARPLLACRDNAWQRTAKWTRRHPTTALAAVLLAVCSTAIAITTGVLTTHAAEADTLAAQATLAQEQEARRADEAAYRAMLAEGRYDEVMDRLGVEVQFKRDVAIDEFNRRLDDAEERLRSQAEFVDELGPIEAHAYYLQFEKLISMHQRYPERVSVGAREYSHLGLLEHLIEKRPDRAVGWFDRAYELADSDWMRAAVLTNIGAALVDMGKPDAALARFTEAIDAAPRIASARFNRAQLLEQRGDLQGAVADYTALLELDDRDFKALINRGALQIALGQPALALRDFDAAVELNDAQASAWSNRAYALTELGQHQRALEAATRAIELDGRDSGAYLNRGCANAGLGHEVAAMRDYGIALALDPTNARAYFNRGILYYRAGEFDAAVDDYTEAARFDPDDDQIYSNRGVARQARNDIDGAIDDYGKAIELNPNGAPPYFNRAILLQARGEQRAAVADYTEAIRIDPTIAAAYYNRGNIQWNLNQHREAAEDYRLAVEQNPELWQAWAARGILLATFNEREGARGCFAQALRHAPEAEHPRIEEQRLRYLGE